MNSRTFIAAICAGIAVLASPAAAELRTATFAGGCFWCMEPPFEKLDGVKEVVSGFANGEVENPSYKQVSAGGTGHVEAVQVTYDPDIVSYETLLEVYWPNTDPLDGGGQFCDRGETYRPAVFYHDEAQKSLAQQSRAKAQAALKAEGKIITPIEAFTVFYPAEGYHQDYYKKNPIRYKYYRWNCGRDARLEAVWGEVEKLELFE